mmetsp:Transcript_29601/g.61064  ORF Transcript_29601/g.61064 Transcript_29601/m.61064 type:complete len:240 (+) Transcript_29601:161-880(+)
MHSCTHPVPNTTRREPSEYVTGRSRPVAHLAAHKSGRSGLLRVQHSRVLRPVAGHARAACGLSSNPGVWLPPRYMHASLAWACSFDMRMEAVLAAGVDVLAPSAGRGAFLPRLRLGVVAREVVVHEAARGITHVANDVAFRCGAGLGGGRLGTGALRGLDRRGAHGRGGGLLTQRLWAGRPVVAEWLAAQLVVADLAGERRLGAIPLVLVAVTCRREDASDACTDIVQEAGTHGHDARA